MKVRSDKDKLQKVVLTIILFFCCQSVFSQHLFNVYNQEDSNVLYTHYYNKIFIGESGSDDGCDSLQFIGDGLEIIKSAKFNLRCHYFVRLLRNDVREIKCINAHNKIITLPFSVTNKIPFDPVIGNVRTEGGAFVQRSLDSVFCAPHFDDEYNRKLKFKIVSYNIDIRRKNDVVYFERVIGNRVSDKFMPAMMKVRAGDKIFLTSIVMVDDLGTEFKIGEDEIKLAIMQ